MAYTVIEATSAAQRDAYKKSAEYKEFAKEAKTVDEGITAGVVEYNEGTGAEITLDIYWLLIEGANAEDNATYRINNAGVAEFSATGVEI